MTAKEEALSSYDIGLQLLKEQKPAEAILYLQKAVKINHQLKEAKNALEDVLEALSWNASYFCRKCGKAIFPNSSYPFLNIDGFCPKCGESVPTQKEMVISALEVGLKLFFFGIFPILIFLFCGVPNYQFIPRKGTVEVTWNDLTDGIFQAMAFTPIMLFIMILINDPDLIWKINYYMFSPFQGQAYFIVGLLFLFFVIYIYFFILLTPIIALHKKGLWKTKEHQKKMLIYTAIFAGIIAVIRVSFGIFR